MSEGVESEEVVSLGSAIRRLMTREEPKPMKVEEQPKVDPEYNAVKTVDGNLRFSSTLGGMPVKDHFSLSNPTSTITFADDEALVLVDNMEQVAIEKKAGTNYFVAKQATVSSPGLVFSRFAYSLVAVLMAGFVFIFCIQIVLFLFLGLAIESGKQRECNNLIWLLFYFRKSIFLTFIFIHVSFWCTGLTSKKEFSWLTFFGTILSLPIFVNGLSQVMVIANTFVIDTWKGSKFMKTVVSWDSTLVDWLTLFVFFGFPLIIGSISLCTGTGEWWKITATSWFSLVFLYYVIFAFSAMYFEVDGCLELVRYHPKLRNLHDPDSNERTTTTFLRATILRMKQRLSGYTSVTFVAQGSDIHPENMTYDEIKVKPSFRSYTGPISWLSRSCILSKLYTVLDKVERQYSLDEVLEFTPYVTRSSWGLESMYFRNRDSRFIAVVDGMSALTAGQVRSSMICWAFGTLITLFVILSLLVWLGAPSSLVVVVTVVYFVSLIDNARKTVGLRAAYKSILTAGGGHGDRSSKTSTAVYLVKESFRITEPKELCYWVALSFNIFFFFVVPIIALFSSGNYRVAIVFIVLGVITTLRDVFNAPAVLQELGSLDGIEINNVETDGLSEWREKHRLSKILTEISVGKRTKFWTGVFLFFIWAFCGVFLAAVTLGADNGAAEPVTFLPKDLFYYEGSKALNYASCSLGHNILSPDGMFNSLADFTFLGNIAYLDDNHASDALSNWFDVSAENLSADVEEFKTSYQEKNGASSVLYKLFTFPDSDLNIVSVRGTSNAWDALTDAQLWSSAALAQYVREALPLGGLWTPILPYLVKAVSIIEDKALEDVSYYKETSAFVKSLKEKGKNVEIVGHCKFTNQSTFSNLFVCLIVVTLSCLIYLVN